MSRMTANQYRVLVEKQLGLVLKQRCEHRPTHFVARSSRTGGIHTIADPELLRSDEDRWTEYQMLLAFYGPSED